MKELFVQTTLVPGTTGGIPLPHRDRHYVPIIQPHRGELEALTQASAEVRARLTPFIEVATMKGVPDEIAPQSPLFRLGDSLQHAIGEDHLFFLDFNEHLSQSKVMKLVQQCSLHALRFIPVVRPDHAKQGLAVIGAVGRERGICIRLAVSPFTPSGVGLDDELQEFLITLGMDRPEVDLLLDLGQLHGILTAEDVVQVLGDITDLQEWRSLILAGTTMPSGLSKDLFKMDADTELPRREWTLYRDVRASDVPRMPTFGDYIVQGASRPAKGFRPVPNLRYTADDHTVVLRGNQNAKNETQYAAICGRAVQLPEFRGGRFSPGDASIEACARGNLVLRDQEAMRSAGTAHHIRIVTTVLQQMQ